MTYKHPDKIDVYAVALQSDIGAERFQQVVDSKLETFWIGTVYGGGVATKRGHKFKTPEEAWNNASDAAGTARPLPTRPCAPLTKAQNCATTRGRPGAMDAFALPSLHMGRRYWRDGRVEEVQE